MRTLGVSAVADGDERLNASTAIGAAAPERPGVTESDIGDHVGDRSTALTMIACPIQSRAHAVSVPERLSDIGNSDALFLPPFNRAGPDCFYIELVSLSTLARLLSHT